MCYSWHSFCLVYRLYQYFGNKANQQAEFFYKFYEMSMSTNPASSQTKVSNIPAVLQFFIWSICSSHTKLRLKILTEPSWTKWPSFCRTAFSNAFSWIKIIEFRFKCHFFPDIKNNAPHSIAHVYSLVTGILHIEGNVLFLLINS